MTWLTPDPGDHPAKRLRTSLEAGGTLTVPGVYNGLTSLLAKQAGAQALYLSGSGLAASMGMPDVGLVTLDELARAARQIVRVTRSPLIVDADTGFGSALNVMRAVRELEGARCAAIQIEDQVDPKRSGHLEGIRVVEAEAFAEKVAAARTAAQHLVVIAKTDARAPAGFEEAVQRGRRYREAGADVVFPEALRTEDEFAEYAREVPGPLLANMTEFGRSPSLSVNRLAELGYRMVVFPVSAARVAASRILDFYADLLRDGEPGAWVDRMLARDALFDLVAYDEYATLDRELGQVHLTRDRPPGEPPPRG